MKKRVRVYQRGGFNAFEAPVIPAMRIAQDGANVQQPQYTDEQLVSAVMSIIGEQGGSPEDALQQLVSAGVEQKKANAVVSSAIEYINQQGAGQQQPQQQGPTEEEQALAEEEARMQEQQQEAADRQARYNAQMANDEADLADSDADIDQFASDYIMRNGGSLPSKRTFVKNVMKLTKKAAGGPGDSGKADDTDIPGGRQAGLQAFVGDLKNKSNNYLQEQDLKAMHDMYSQQMETPYADPNSYMQEPEMQFGGMRPGQQRRLERRANRMAGMVPSAFFNAQQQMFPQGINIMGMPGMMPGMAAMGPQAFQMPARGLYAGGPRLANIQVHKTGLFGRPKAWTATFDNSSQANPNQWLQDMARMNQANQQTEYKDVNFDNKEEETNTATSENAEVKNEEVKAETTTTGGGEGTTTETTTPNPDTGEEVNEEVENNADNATYEGMGIDYARYFPGAQPITRENLGSRTTNPYPTKVDPKTLDPNYSQDLADQGYYNNGDVASIIGRGVTPGKVPVPNKGTQVKPTLSDLGSTKMIPGMKSVQKSEPVKLKIEGEAVFKLKSGDTKSHFVNKNGKIYKTSKLGDESQWYEIKDPERIQNIISLSGRSANAFDLSKSNKAPGINDFGMDFPKPPVEKKQPINFEAAEDFRGYAGTVLEPQGTRFSDKVNPKEEIGYTWKNGKLYKTLGWDAPVGQEPWYEITDPQRIATITRAMKAQKLVIPGEDNKFNTQIAQLINNGKAVKMSIPSSERFASKYFNPEYKDLVIRNGKLYYNTKSDSWIEVNDPKIVSTVMKEQSIGSMPFIPSGPASNRSFEMDLSEAFQMGGMTDQQSELYRFMGGGEDISIPTLNERNTADPYFAYGGYFEDGGGKGISIDYGGHVNYPVTTDANGNRVICTTEGCFPTNRSTGSQSTSQGGGMVAINDASGNRKYVTQNEADAWNSAIKDNADLSLNDMSWASESPRQNPNYRTWDDLKDKGVNVGDFREGIDYSQLEKFPKTTNSNTASTSYNNYPMYNPAIGAMYPPLFGGGRRFSPAGRMFEYAGSWAKQKGMPFDPRTGQMLGQMPTDLPLTKLDVTKSSMFGRRPKEYTMYFGNYGQLGDNLPKGTPGAEGTAAEPGKDNSRRNRFAERLMRTPGLRKLGAKLYEQPNLPLPEGTEYTEEQMPSLPLRPIGNIPAGELVPDQYNKLGQPTLDLTGLKDAPIPEITPEEFSFADQQRFGNIQGPLNQEEATGIGSLPMRPLSNIPTQYNDQLMANSFSYSPQGMLKAADIDELQRFIPQPQGAITEEDYANQLDLLGFPDPAPVMRDINGNAIQPGQGTPMNIAGPMSDMSNLPDEQGYFNDLQLEQNQEQRIANLPPESASYDYYQDVMQPNRDQSVYPFGAQEGMTEGEFGQQAQENLEDFDPMRLPDESYDIEPWMTQEMVDAQIAKREAAEARRQAEILRRRNAESEVAQRRGPDRNQNNVQVQGVENENRVSQTKPSYGKLNRELKKVRKDLEAQGYTEDQIVQQLDFRARNTDFEIRYGADRPMVESYMSLVDEVNRVNNLPRAGESIKRQARANLENFQRNNKWTKNFNPDSFRKELQREEQSQREAEQRAIEGERRGQVRSIVPYWMQNTLEQNRRDGGVILPKAQFGPTTGMLTTNPDLVGFSDIDLLNSQTYPEVSGSVNNVTGNWWSASPNMPTIQETGMLQPEEMTIDPNQQYTQQIKREYDPRGAAVKFKVKDMYNVDFEKGVNRFNAGVNMGLSALGEIGDRNRGAQMFNNLNSGIYGSTKALKRGTYETNSGLLEPDKMGFKGVVRQGGNIKRQGGPAYKTGGVTYMSADQVKRFLAEGGELEFV